MSRLIGSQVFFSCGSGYFYHELLVNVAPIWQLYEHLKQEITPVWMIQMMYFQKLEDLKMTWKLSMVSKPLFQFSDTYPLWQVVSPKFFGPTEDFSSPQNHLRKWWSFIIFTRLVFLAGKDLMSETMIYKKLPQQNPGTHHSVRVTFLASFILADRSPKTWQSLIQTSPNSNEQTK